MPFTYQWPRPALTVDTIVVAAPEPTRAQPKVLLIQRKHPPCKGKWAIPGGFVDEGEPLQTAAARELHEETSVSPDLVNLQQVRAYGDPGRDPRGWSVTVSYVALVPSTSLGVKAADDAVNAEWYDVTSVPELAFDHKVLLRDAFRQLAKTDEAASSRELVDALQAGAAALDGPWTPPTV